MKNLTKMIKKTQEDIEKINKNRENLISQLSEQEKQKEVLNKKIDTTKNDLEKLTKKINNLLRQFDVKTSKTDVKTFKKRGPKKGTKHYKNEMSLKEAVEKVMKPNVEMSPKDVASMVKEIGYKTKQKNKQFFRSSICTILRNDNSIKKIGRGNYVLASKKNKGTVAA
ncbi:hypothetical protein K9M42_02880 [Patescibacteria group bacterium]|nr:hypothetical protein [Patescibacteria group bacterium]